MKYDPDPSRGYSSVQVNRDENNSMSNISRKKKKKQVQKNERGQKHWGLLGERKRVKKEISGSDAESM